MTVKEWVIYGAVITGLFIALIIIGELLELLGLKIFIFLIGLAAVIYVLFRKGIIKKLFIYLNEFGETPEEKLRREEEIIKYKKECREREEKERKEKEKISQKVEEKKEQKEQKEQKETENPTNHYEAKPLKNTNTNTISTLPIDYVPRAEQSFSSKDADYTYRKIYITLIWLALPLMAIFRYKIGVRVLSSFNVVVAIVLLVINLKITQNLLAFRLADNTIIFTALLLLFIIGLRKPLVLALSVIFILVGSAIYGFYLSYSMGEAKATALLANQQSIDIGAAVFLMLLISVVLIARKIISFYHEKEGAPVHSYYYGRSVFFLIFRKDWITNIIIEPLLVGFFGVIMFNAYRWYESTYAGTYYAKHLGEAHLAIGYMLLVSAIASCLVSIMQQYAIRDYHQDIRDVEHLSKEATQKQAEEREAEQTVYQARGISQE